MDWGESRIRLVGVGILAECAESTELEKTNVRALRFDFD
jgi:hypothetical protein